MNSMDLQSVLDGLDRRLALGEVDLTTYQSLHAKFTSQMSQGAGGAGDPLAAAVGGLAKQAQAIKCPGCMAPLPVPRDGSAAAITCEFCGGSYSLKTATDEMERLRSDIRKWVADLAGGVASNSTIDEASRRFIFKDKLLPSLRLAADRATETFGMVRHGPLFCFPLASDVPDSPFLAALQAMPDSTTVVERVKMTEARTDSPEILAFAVADADRHALRMLQIQCQESIRLAAVRRNVFSYDADGFAKSLANINALRELYASMSDLTSVDAARVQFARALARRMSAVAEAIAQLDSLFKDRDGVVTDPIVSTLRRAAVECEASALDVERSGVELSERVPAAEGARVDAQTIRILTDSVKLFALCGAEQGYEFRQFMGALSALVSRARSRNDGLDWLSSFIGRLALHAAAIRGEQTIAIVDDFSTVEAEAAAGCLSGLFSGKETVSVAQRLLVPFWVAEVNVAQQTGVIFKSGHAAQEFLFVEAFSNRGRSFRADKSSAIGAGTARVLTSTSSLRGGIEGVAPIVGKDRALALLKSAVQATPGYTGAQPRVLGLVYLPAITAVYATRKGQRQRVLVAGAGEQFDDLQLRHSALGTIQINIA